ncbi:ATP-binding cassette domain-containing protein [Lactobacillus helsingborgensis]|uniref:ATP-binding cassette domain-containing protein n=1 Tax=Lactobacillus helsingborgensis TaxID=1218494 RepID=UPI0027404D10|nr:ATP-binding cassette domain-containing protein [Lactobacillus helsingborgensis]WLT00466.1 ATP-binding cassette domain-containing protein [Lactobacillus helsingborgensis]
MEIKHLNFSYKKKEIFADFNAKFVGDQLNVIIGSNGAGKTTLLNLIYGFIDRPATAMIDFPSMSNIIYKFQNMSFFDELTVKQVINFFKSMNDHTVAVTNAQVRFYNEIIKELINTKLRSLSGGEYQCVMVYCTSIMERELYLFDEPLSGIDSYIENLILALVESLVVEKKKKVIMTLHQLAKLNSLQAHIVFVGNKKCVFQGNLSQMLQAADTDDIDIAFKRMRQAVSC